MRRLLLLTILSCIILSLPNLGSAACTAPPIGDTSDLSDVPTFDDVMGTWHPLSRLIWESGDILVKEHEIVYLKDKARIAITVICKIDPIIIKREASYSWLELKTWQTLCFHDYANREDAELKNPNAPASFYCYTRLVSY